MKRVVASATRVGTASADQLEPSHSSLRRGQGAFRLARRAWATRWTRVDFSASRVSSLYWAAHGQVGAALPNRAPAKTNIVPDLTHQLRYRHFDERGVPLWNLSGPKSSIMNRPRTGLPSPLRPEFGTSVDDLAHIRWTDSCTQSCRHEAENAPGRPDRGCKSCGPSGRIALSRLDAELRELRVIRRPLGSVRRTPGPSFFGGLSWCPLLYKAVQPMALHGSMSWGPSKIPPLPPWPRS